MDISNKNKFLGKAVFSAMFRENRALFVMRPEEAGGGIARREAASEKAATKEKVRNFKDIVNTVDREEFHVRGDFVYTKAAGMTRRFKFTDYPEVMDDVLAVDKLLKTGNPEKNRLARASAIKFLLRSAILEADTDKTGDKLEASNDMLRKIMTAADNEALQNILTQAREERAGVEEEVANDMIKAVPGAGAAVALDVPPSGATREIADKDNAPQAYAQDTGAESPETLLQQAEITGDLERKATLIIQAGEIYRRNGEQDKAKKTYQDFIDKIQPKIDGYKKAYDENHGNDTARIQVRKLTREKGRVQTALLNIDNPDPDKEARELAGRITWKWNLDGEVPEAFKLGIAKILLQRPFGEADTVEITEVSRGGFAESKFNVKKGKKSLWYYDGAKLVKEADKEPTEPERPAEVPADYELGGLNVWKPKTLDANKPRPVYDTKGVEIEGLVYDEAYNTKTGYEWVNPKDDNSIAVRKIVQAEPVVPAEPPAPPAPAAQIETDETNLAAEGEKEAKAAEAERARNRVEAAPEAQPEPPAAEPAPVAPAEAPVETNKDALTLKNEGREMLFAARQKKATDRAAYKTESLAAIEKFKAAEEKARETNDTITMAASEWNIGMANYKDLGNYDEAERYFSVSTTNFEAAGKAKDAQEAQEMIAEIKAAQAAIPKERVTKQKLQEKYPEIQELTGDEVAAVSRTVDLLSTYMSDDVYTVENVLEALTMANLMLNDAFAGRPAPRRIDITFKANGKEAVMPWALNAGFYPDETALNKEEAEISSEWIGRQKEDKEKSVLIQKILDLKKTIYGEDSKQYMTFATDYAKSLKVAETEDRVKGFEGKALFRLNNIGEVTKGEADLNEQFDDLSEEEIRMYIGQMNGWDTVKKIMVEKFDFDPHVAREKIAAIISKGDNKEITFEDVLELRGFEKSKKLPELLNRFFKKIQKDRGLLKTGNFFLVDDYHFLNTPKEGEEGVEITGRDGKKYFLNQGELISQYFSNADHFMEAYQYLRDEVREIKDRHKADTNINNQLLELQNSADAISYEQMLDQVSLKDTALSNDEQETVELLAMMQEVVLTPALTLVEACKDLDWPKKGLDRSVYSDEDQISMGVEGMQDYHTTGDILKFVFKMNEEESKETVKKIVAYKEGDKTVLAERDITVEDISKILLEGRDDKEGKFRKILEREKPALKHLCDAFNAMRQKIMAENPGEDGKKALKRAIKKLDKNPDKALDLEMQVEEVSQEVAVSEVSTIFNSLKYTENDSPDYIRGWFAGAESDQPVMALQNGDRIYLDEGLFRQFYTPISAMLAHLNKPGLYKAERKEKVLNRRGLIFEINRLLELGYSQLLLQEEIRTKGKTNMDDEKFKPEKYQIASLEDLENFEPEQLQVLQVGFMVDKANEHFGAIKKAPEFSDESGETGETPKVIADILEQLAKEGRPKKQIEEIRRILIGRLEFHFHNPNANEWHDYINPFAEDAKLALAIAISPEIHLSDGTTMRIVAGINREPKSGGNIGGTVGADLTHELWENDGHKISANFRLGISLRKGGSAIGAGAGLAWEHHLSENVKGTLAAGFGAEFSLDFRKAMIGGNVSYTGDWGDAIVKADKEDRTKEALEKSGLESLWENWENLPDAEKWNLIQKLPGFTEINKKMEKALPQYSEAERQDLMIRGVDAYVYKTGKEDIYDKMSASFLPTSVTVGGMVGVAGWAAGLGLGPGGLLVGGLLGTTFQIGSVTVFVPKPSEKNRLAEAVTSAKLSKEMADRVMRRFEAITAGELSVEGRQVMPETFVNPDMISKKGIRIMERKTLDMSDLDYDQEAVKFNADSAKWSKADVRLQRNGSGDYELITMNAGDKKVEIHIDPLLRSRIGLIRRDGKTFVEGNINDMIIERLRVTYPDQSEKGRESLHDIVYIRSHESVFSANDLDFTLENEDEFLSQEIGQESFSVKRGKNNTEEATQENIIDASDITPEIETSMGEFLVSVKNELSKDPDIIALNDEYNRAEPGAKKDKMQEDLERFYASKTTEKISKEIKRWETQLAINPKDKLVRGTINQLRILRLKEQRVLFQRLPEQPFNVAKFEKAVDDSKKMHDAMEGVDERNYQATVVAPEVHAFAQKMGHNPAFLKELRKPGVIDNPEASHKLILEKANAAGLSLNAKELSVAVTEIMNASFTKFLDGIKFSSAEEKIPTKVQETIERRLTKSKEYTKKAYLLEFQKLKNEGKISSDPVEMAKTFANNIYDRPLAKLAERNPDLRYSAVMEITPEFGENRALLSATKGHLVVRVPNLPKAEEAGEKYGFILDTTHEYSTNSSYAEERDIARAIILMSGQEVDDTPELLKSDLARKILGTEVEVKMNPDDTGRYLNLYKLVTETQDGGGQAQYDAVLDIAKDPEGGAARHPREAEKFQHFLYEVRQAQMAGEPIAMETVDGVKFDISMSMTVIGGAHTKCTNGSATISEAGSFNVKIQKPVERPDMLNSGIAQIGQIKDVKADKAYIEVGIAVGVSGRSTKKPTTGKPKDDTPGPGDKKDGKGVGGPARVTTADGSATVTNTAGARRGR